MPDSSVPARTRTALRGRLDPWFFLWQLAKRLPGSALALRRADPGLRGSLLLLSSRRRVRVLGARVLGPLPTPSAAAAKAVRLGGEKPEK
ncbi:hypothetical protein DL765_004103 [Monosporascus sp. GIB2]|nr:hypothetical protein DL765_004103 [Monosporascus sp. GIB2]